MGLVVVINVFSGVLQGGGTGLAGCLPPEYMKLVLYGQGAGGIFAALCQLGCLIVGTSPQASGLLYFSSAIFTFVVTLACFVVALKLEFTQHYLTRQVSKVPEGPKSKDKGVPYMKIFLQGWPLYTSILATFWITMSIFPGLSVLVVSSNAQNGSRWSNDLYTTWACFTVFNVVCLVGRVFAVYLPIPAKQSKLILALSLMRVVLIPLFMGCNAMPNKRHFTPIWFGEDWHYVLFMCILGATHGYLTNLGMVYACKTTTAEYEEIGGSLTAVSLGIGLLLGTLSSSVFIRLL